MQGKLYLVYYWKAGVDDKGRDKAELLGKGFVWDYGVIPKAQVAFRNAKKNQIEANRLVFERVNHAR